MGGVQRFCGSGDGGRLAFGWYQLLRRLALFPRVAGVAGVLIETSIVLAGPLKNHHNVYMFVRIIIVDHLLPLIPVLLLYEAGKKEEVREGGNRPTKKLKVYTVSVLMTQFALEQWKLLPCVN